MKSEVRSDKGFDNGRKYGDRPNSELEPPQDTGSEKPKPLFNTLLLDDNGVTLGMSEITFSPPIPKERRTRYHDELLLFG